MEISDVITSVGAYETAIVPFEFLAVSSSHADQLLCAKQNIAEQCSLPATWRGETYAHDRIRIGYFSADLSNHPAGQLAVGLLEARDKSRFETVALSSDDNLKPRRRTKSAVELFIDLENTSDADLAALISRLGRMNLYYTRLRILPIHAKLFNPGPESCTYHAHFEEFMYDQIRSRNIPVARKKNRCESRK